MIFLKLILTNLLHHRIRSLISLAGIAFSVTAMLTIVTILQGAVGMFSGILSSDSQVIVFERNVSDLFFSNVPADGRLRKATWLEGSRDNFAHRPLPLPHEHPRILLADEPTGSLDRAASSTVFQLLLDIAATEGVTLVMATHDRALAARRDCLVEMRDGRIREPQPTSPISEGTLPYASSSRSEREARSGDAPVFPTSTASISPTPAALTTLATDSVILSAAKDPCSSSSSEPQGSPAIPRAFIVHPLTATNGDNA